MNIKFFLIGILIGAILFGAGLIIGYIKGVRDLDNYLNKLWGN